MPSRDGPLSNLKAPLYWAAGAGVILSLAAAGMLVFSDRREGLDEAGYSAAREVADQIQAPISGALSAPIGWVESVFSGVGGYFGAVSENRVLRRQLQEMNDLKAQYASLQDVNERYAALLGLRTDPPVDMVSGRAVTDSRGPYANSRLINVGSSKGVKVGNPVMSENGLVGRVVGTSPGVSRVLLLTDVASRVPVMLDRTNARSILTGDGGPNPLLDVLRTREPPVPGDVVVTSGDGGFMPRGLPVGVVVQGVNGTWRVSLSSDLEPIDYVRVLKYEGLLGPVDEAALSRPIMPSEMGGQLPPPPAPAAPVVATPPTTATPAPTATPAAAAPAVTAPAQ